VGGFYDQGALNISFNGSWDPVDIRYNYRIYSGFLDVTQDAFITHLHGPKIEDIRNYLKGDLQLIHPPILDLFNKNITGYLDFLDFFDKQ
jgi:hypothetical protein